MLTNPVDGTWVDRRNTCPWDRQLSLIDSHGATPQPASGIGFVRSLKRSRPSGISQRIRSSQSTTPSFLGDSRRRRRYPHGQGARLQTPARIDLRRSIPAGAPPH